LSSLSAGARGGGGIAHHPRRGTGIRSWGQSLAVRLRSARRIPAAAPRCLTPGKRGADRLHRFPPTPGKCLGCKCADKSKMQSALSTGWKARMQRKGINLCPQTNNNDLIAKPLSEWPHLGSWRSVSLDFPQTSSRSAAPLPC